MTKNNSDLYFTSWFPGRKCPHEIPFNTQCPPFFRLWPNKKKNIFHHKTLYHWLTPLPPNFQIFLRLCKDNESFALDFAEGGPRDFLDCILRTNRVEGSYISDVITWLSNLEGIYMLESTPYTDFVLISFKVTTKRWSSLQGKI